MTRVVVLVVLAGCARNPTPLVAPTPSPSVEAGARFIGSWRLDQPFHGAYEATIYDFQEDGTLEIQDGFGLPACDSGPGLPCTTGTVAHCPELDEFGRCEGELTCLFGTRWSALDAVTLLVSGECSDGLEREIELLVPESSEAVTPVVLTVGAEPGWGHDWWEWAFTRCADDNGTACLPF